jgi:hypothetical protein
MIAGIRTTCATSAYHGEVYSIQYYVIKFVSDLRQIGVFSPVSFTNKTDRLAITVILLKVTLNTITITPFSCYNVTLYTPNCVTEFWVLSDLIRKNFFWKWQVVHLINKYQTNLMPPHYISLQGRIQGGAHPPPPKIGKNMIFWRKIVIFHTKYPKNFRASLCIWKKSDFFGVKSWFFTRNTPKFFAPPSARRNFLKGAPPPLTWNPGSAPDNVYGSSYYWNFRTSSFKQVVCLILCFNINFF